MGVKIESTRPALGPETAYLLKALDGLPRGYQVLTQGNTGQDILAVGGSVQNYPQGVVLDTQRALSVMKQRKGFFLGCWVIVNNPLMQFQVFLDGSNKIDFSVDSIANKYKFGLKGVTGVLLSNWLYDECFQLFGVWCVAPIAMPFDSKCEINIRNSAAATTYRCEYAEGWWAVYDEMIARDYFDPLLRGQP